MPKNVYTTEQLHSFCVLVSSLAQLCPTLCDTIDCSTPGFPVHHQLPELAQTHVHWVSDVIKPSHSLSSPSAAFNLSQHQGLFQWLSSSHQVAKVLELQQQSFQWVFRTDFLYNWLVWSPCSLRDSQESSQTLQLKSINSSALSFLYSPTLTSIHDYWKNHSFDKMDFVSKVKSLLFSILVIVSSHSFSFGHSFSSKEQVSFNFMAAITICSDFGAPPKIKSVTVSIVSPSICHEVMGPDAMILVF